MKKNFYSKDNELMWESYHNSPEYYEDEGHEDEEDDDLDLGLGGAADDFDDFEMGMDEGDEDFDDHLGGGSKIVMEFEPPGELDVEEHEVNEVLVSDLKKLAEYAQRLQDKAQSADFEDWMVAKITVASDYVSDVWHRLDAKADFANTGFEQAEQIEF